MTNINLDILTTYDSSGTGLQRFSIVDYYYPPQDNIPDNALFGLWDFTTETWLNEWYYNHNDAQEDADGVSRSGFNYGVISIDGWEYFNPSGF